LNYRSDFIQIILSIKAMSTPKDGKKSVMAYVAIYSFSLFCLGLFSNSIGTLIIFLSEAYKVPET
jgi:hypothetical protein